MQRRIDFISRLTVAAVAIAATAFAAPVTAQSYPARALKFVVGFPPGGLTDINARLVARNIEGRVGQSVIVENRPGANGTIAANAVLQSPADGYTLFVGGGTSISSFMTKASSIDPLRDFATVSNVVTGGMFFFVRANLPIRTMRDLIDYAKARPGKVNFGSSSPNTEIIFQALKGQSGLEAASIPYKGGVPTVQALLADEVDISADSVPPYIPHIQSGKIRPLFTTTKSSLYPDVPTVDQIGLKDFNAIFNLGVWAPAATPRDVVNRLSQEVQAVVKMPDVAEQFRKSGNEPTVTSPEEHRRLVEAEIRFWREAARIARYEAQ